MIKVESITIEEFRGIRSLTLVLGKQNFAVCGPNGTGKSGLVDGLEFGLTGNISRLSGKGRGLLSVKDHGPHVDSKAHPERAKVTLDVFIPSLNKSAHIVRSVKSPKAPIITPADADIKAVLAQIEQHPEIVLSRREIIKYVLAEPGERAKEVQALLQLDELETARATLQKIANACDRELKPLESTRTSRAQELARAMGIADLKVETILGAANEKRKTLSLPPLPKLESTTSLRDGLESLSSSTTPGVPKVQATADVMAAKNAVTELDSEDAKAKIKAALTALENLKADESKLKGVEREGMLRTALEFFDDKSCPVCETAWEPEDFRATVHAQLKHLEAVAGERKAAEGQVAVVIQAYEACETSLRIAAIYGAKLAIPVDVTSFSQFRDGLRDALGHLQRLLPLDAAIHALALDEDKRKAAATCLEHLEAQISALPDPSDRDAARDYLTVADERLTGLRGASSLAVAAKKKAAIARRVFEIYGKETDSALADIYKEVEQEFRDFYRTINEDDESAFEAKLQPSLGKLGFDVDFYGRGFFPPGAYHSEGHQDGMGLCLYLAMMKHLLGAGFTFCVLDDVLMSVDAGHRREACALLKTVFPNTQFVLTTHDPVWLKQMITSGLIKTKSAIEFRKWDIDHGPAEWKSADVWAEIKTLVASNEIPSAAGLLRRHLEHVSAELCGFLGGRVEYRPDGKYELGDLLPAAAAAMRKLLGEAKNAANSWGQKDVVATLAERDEKFSKALGASNAEQWSVNASIHYNEWAKLERADFVPVVAAFAALEQEFRCSACDGYIYLVRSGKDNETLKCDCGATSISLTKKKVA